MTSYLDTILRVSEKQLHTVFTSEELVNLRELCEPLREKDRDVIIREFSAVYRDMVKRKHQGCCFLKPCGFRKALMSRQTKVKAVSGHCLGALQYMRNESVDLFVTSPPYYNAREYTQWKSLEDYLRDMEAVFRESYRVLDNHRAFVLNIGDVVGNDNLVSRSAWAKRRIPLAAHLTLLMEKCGFTFVDDFIWDKGNPQSHRHKGASSLAPFRCYPVNSYEHILVFFKHRSDSTPFPCPICGCLKVVGNAYSGVGVRSWECRNLGCFQRSAGGRGKRFSLRSIVMGELKSNRIDRDLVNFWRRDIVRISPVVKVNSKGENRLGHTAPFPMAIPEFAVSMFSGKGELVVDPFAGLFTAPIAATKLGRFGVGIEINGDSFREAAEEYGKSHGILFEEVSPHFCVDPHFCTCGRPH